MNKFLKMKTIDKMRLYVRSITKTEDEYNKRLSEIWVNPNYRNEECMHPEHDTCATCPLNKLRSK